MVKAIPKDNAFRFFGRNFKSLDLFTRLFIVTVILFAIASPFIVYNYQTFNARGQTQAESLREIQRIQQEQNNLRNKLARSSTTSYPPESIANAAVPVQTNGFNLFDIISRIFSFITRIF
jgi:hypothetical protein